MTPLGDAHLWLYDPIRHRLQRVVVGNIQKRQIFVERVEEFAPAASVTVIVLAAHVARTSAAYENVESLVWRDAGVVIATLQLAATSLDLAFTPLGILGTDLISSLNESDRNVVAAGVCLVGARASGAPQSG